jgi:glycine/D-amino acid oxidase-like deaminating enzyme
VAEQAPVAVLGGGVAGLCAAVAASDAGADVVLLEAAQVGGSTAISGGLVWGPRTSPRGRVGQPTDVAPLVGFRCSDASSYLTGAEIAVDGGRSSGGQIRGVANAAAAYRRAESAQETRA